MKQVYIKAAIQLIDAGTSVDVLVTNLKTVLSKRGHLKLLPDILSGLLNQIDVNENAKVAKVIIAKDSDKDSDSIKQALSALSATDTAYTVQVDPNIIGGVVATYKNRQIDQSYRTKLRELYQSIINTKTIIKK
jgi:F0F1-type ATP synthase delta subunit